MVQNVQPILRWLGSLAVAAAPAPLVVEIAIDTFSYFHV